MLRYQPGCSGRAALRGDDDPALAHIPVEQREDVAVAGLPPGRGQQQRRHRHLLPSRRGHGVHVAIGAAAREVAVGVLHHPVRQVRGKPGFGHGRVSLGQARPKHRRGERHPATQEKRSIARRLVCPAAPTGLIGQARRLRRRGMGTSWRQTPGSSGMPRIGRRLPQGDGRATQLPWKVAAAGRQPVAAQLDDPDLPQQRRIDDPQQPQPGQPRPTARAAARSPPPAPSPPGRSPSPASAPRSAAGRRHRCWPRLPPPSPACCWCRR